MTEATLTLPALDPETVEVRTGTTYPDVYKDGVEAREKRVIGDPLGLTQFGVNRVRLAPGVMSSQRHWHSHEDEFVIILEGELTLVTDAGEQVLSSGMAAGFSAGSGDGHHIINKSEQDAVYLEVGGRDGQDDVDYPDIDMIRRTRDGAKVFLRKDETPYE